jgi:hypothetical protein
MKIISVLLILFFLSSSRVQDLKNENLIVILLAKNISQLSEIKCSQFIDQFEYIPLETNEKCLIGNDYHALVLKDYILIYHIKYCYVFDKKTGKFLFELSKYGRGPGEYNNSLLAYDFVNSIVYSGGWNNDMMMFTLDGKYIGSFPIPNQKGGMEDPSLMFHFSSLPKSLIVGYSINILGSEKKLLTIFNQKGEVIRIFPNKNVYPKRPLKVVSLLEAQFYHLNENTYFKERYCDTVFRVTEKSLIPHIKFDMGKYTVPYDSKWWPFEEQKNAKFIIVRQVLENRSWIYITATKESIDYFAIFDKNISKLSINRYNAGIPNDIDNFIPFKPEYIDEDGNLVALVNALEISKWFKDNPSKISERIKRLQNTEPDQNPIVIIGNTKTN